MSIKATVEKTHEDMRKPGKLRHIEVSVSVDKKHYIATHKHESYEPDTPMHVLKSKGALAAHLAKHLEGPGTDTETGDD